VQYFSLKPMKGSKDADFCLVFITGKKQKLPLAVGSQGPMTASRKPSIHPSYEVTHKKTQFQNFPIFLVENTRQSSSLEG